MVFHARHSSLENDDDEPDSSGASHATPKARSRIASRPISSTTTATNTTIKPRKNKPSEGKVPPPATISLHTEIMPLQRTPSNSSQKGKKKHIFGFTLPSPRKASFSSEKSKSRPTTPAQGSGNTGKERGFWGGRSAPGSQRSQESEHKYPTLHDDPNAMRLLTEGKLADSSRSRAAQRPAPIHLLNGEYQDEREIELNDLGGRCSPLCGLGPNKAAVVASEKGKGREIEKVEVSRERVRTQQYSRTEKSRETRSPTAEMITRPKRVGSAIHRERDSRMKVAPSPLPVQKVASGSGSSTRQGALSPTTTTATIARMKRIKHGSFDFERPISAGVVGEGNANIRLASRRDSSDRESISRNGASHSLDISHCTSSRSGSTAEQVARSMSPVSPIMPASGRDKGKQRPVLDVATGTTTLSRRTTGSSTATSTRQRVLVAPYSRANNNSNNNNNSETDPASPTSSHSASSSAPNSSWGRSGGKRIARGAHGPFKFEPAVPPIPGSPATDRRRGIFDAQIPSSRPSPSRVNTSSPLAGPAHSRPAGRGRSLDLGLGLSWAPNKVREEAVLQRPSMSTNGNGRARPRARWKDGVDEEGRLGGTVVGAASDVATAFREALGDAAYSTFKNCAYSVVMFILVIPEVRRLLTDTTSFSCRCASL